MRIQARLFIAATTTATAAATTVGEAAPATGVKHS
jgi:hypothetical protein